MSKVYTVEHKDRSILIKRYLKDFLKKREVDDLFCGSNIQSKICKECIDKLLEYGQLMPAFIKNLIKKGESFRIEKSGYKHYLTNSETVDEIYGRVEISNDDLDTSCYDYFVYMDHVDFENEGLKYCFQITERNADIFTPEKQWKKGNLTKKWVITMDPIGKDEWN